MLDGVDLQIEAGQTLAVVGPSGCGKSTLLSLICGLLEPDQRRDRGGRRSTAAEGRLRQVRADAADATCCCPGGTRSTTPALALVNAGASRGERPRRGGAAVRAVRAGRLRARRGHRGCRAGCASGWPSCARCWPARACCCSTSRSHRWTRMTREDLQLWLRDALERERRTAVLVTHDVDEALRTCRRIAVHVAAAGADRAARRDGAARPRRRCWRRCADEALRLDPAARAAAARLGGVGAAARDPRLPAAGAERRSPRRCGTTARIWRRRRWSRCGRWCSACWPASRSAWRRRSCCSVWTGCARPSTRC